MRQFIEEATRISLYDSIEDVVSTVGAYWESKGLSKRLIGPKRDYFIGCPFRSFGDIASKVESGWPEGVQVIEEMIDQIKGSIIDPPKTKKRRCRFSEDDGDEIDLDRLRAGNPFWRQCVRQTMAGPAAVNLLIDIGASCRVKADAILWRGAACLAAADIIEEAGYATNIWAVERARNSYTDGLAGFRAVEIKSQTQAVDIASMASAISGWFFRSAMFGACWSFDGARPADGLGYHTSSLPCVKFVSCSGDKTILVESVWDRAAAVKKAREIIAAVGDPA